MNYAISSADLNGDRGEVVALWARNMRAHSTEEYARLYEWVYGQSPLGSGSLFLARQDPGGQLIGTAGIGLRRITVAGDSMLAGVAVDLVVDSGQRTLQPAILLQRRVAAAVSEEMPLLYGFPNQSALGVFLRVGYRKGGRANRYVKLLRSLPYLRRHAVPRPLRHPAAAILDAGLRLTSAETWCSRDVQASEIKPCDPRLATLTCDATVHSAMAIDKGPAFLRWRYENCPVHHYFLLGVGSEGCLVGVVACHLSDDTVNVADIQCRSAPGALSDVFGGLIGWARAQACSAISVEVANPSPAFAAALRRFGFAQREPTETLAAICHPSISGRIDLQSWQVFRDR